MEKLNKLFEDFRKKLTKAHKIDLKFQIEKIFITSLKKTNL